MPDLETSKVLLFGNPQIDNIDQILEEIKNCKNTKIEPKLWSTGSSRTSLQEDPVVMEQMTDDFLKTEK
mgnify:CR=1 FL=1